MNHLHNSSSHLIFWSVRSPAVLLFCEADARSEEFRAVFTCLITLQLKDGANGGNCGKEMKNNGGKMLKL